MKVCRYCGSAAPEGADLCPNCGAYEFDHRCPQCGTVYSSHCCPQCGLPEDAEERVCPSCGARYYSNACPNCGWLPVAARAPYAVDVTVRAAGKPISPKSRTIALILWFAFGIFGVHRFYAGKTGSGVLYLLTAGLFGIGWFVDLFLLLAGSFRDRNGLPILRWEL